MTKKDENGIYGQILINAFAKHPSDDYFKLDTDLRGETICK
jgi:hypothetical protein